MPPKAQWYLLGRNSEEKDNQSNFDKFFDLERIAEGLTVISMEEFLQQTAAKGLLKIPLPVEFQNVKVCSKYLVHLYSTFTSCNYNHYYKCTGNNYIHIRN